MLNTRFLLIPLTVLALVAAACGNGDESEEPTTTGDALATTTTDFPEPAPETTVETTLVTTTTVAPAPTTTLPEATTTLAEAGADPQVDVQARADAAAAALPPDWIFEPDLDPETSDTDFFFTPCLEPDDFDLSNLAAVSTAQAQVNFTGPSTSGFALDNPQGSVEARTFESAETATEAYAVLEKTIGSQEGRDCLATSVSEPLLADAPPGTEAAASVEELTIPGADLAARVAIDLEAEGLQFVVTIDLAATLLDDTTVYSTYVGFGEEFPQDIAGDTMSAAVGG